MTSVLAVGLLAAGTATAVGQAAPGTDIAGTAPTVTADSTSVPATQRADVLGKEWAKATDLAWTTSGDDDGFHILVADAAAGYAWRTLATLSVPGVETDEWIGNACVTASGTRAVVAYAPRTFTNDPTLSARGALTAVVNLRTGAVTPLAIRSSLAYFSPSCGDGEHAVLTQEGGEDSAKTRLIEVDAAKGTLANPIEVPGQLTSAVPTPAGIVAADSGALVRLDASGVRHVVVATTGVAFRLAEDSQGGLTYLERSGATDALVQHIDKPTTRRQMPTTLASGQLSGIDVTSSRGGRVFVTGAATATKSAAPADVSLVNVPKGTQLSLQGHLALTSVLRTQADPRAADPTGVPQQVHITAKALTTGHQTTFAVTPLPAAATQANSAKNNAAVTPNAGNDPNDPSDLAARYCSVPRSDPANQAMQPRPRQVEWAVDQAVRSSLTVQRPANWKNLAMPAYTPQGLFPNIALTGGGNVPAQIMLGIAAQESNLWQAARFAVPGMTADPLIGNYYGLALYDSDPNNDWDINWADADCGYGVTQVTDGMRLKGHEKPGETAMPYQTQRAVALDFAVNVAAGLQILEKKWNETQAAGLKLNNDDASKIENWFYAVWDYNSGLHANTGSGPWGLGWANNPANPHFPANRTAFLDTTYQDAAHPQDWPYPEKVMGWAGHPVQVLDAPDTLVAGYRAAWWNGDSTTGPANRTAVKPPVNQFCDASNNCQPGAKYLPSAPDVVGEPAGPCAHQNSAGQYDLECWYHQASTWKPDCSYSCGNELLRFDPGYAYQDDGTSYPPTCDLSGLPAGAQIADDVPDTTPIIRPDCSRTFTNSGNLTLSFKADPNGTYPGKVDLHQLGAGFDGHMWFSHTRSATTDGGRLEVDGSWKLYQPHYGPMAVYVALPDIGAAATATYTVKTSLGDRTRTISQSGTTNRWVRLGTYMFNGVPEVDLSTLAPSGDGSQDLAFDAVAFVPFTGIYHSHTVEADAQFDENQNLDTSAPSSWLAGPFANAKALYDWAQSQLQAFAALPDCAPGAKGNCLTPAIKAAYLAWQDQVNAAGYDPVKHPVGNSIDDWIGFANPAGDRPTTDTRPSVFDDDNKYKIKLSATVSYVTAPDGTVVDGSQSVDYEHRTGNTHIPKFLLDMIQAIHTDYGIAPPDLDYSMPDLNHHDGLWTTVHPYTNGGIFPGRDYYSAGLAPQIVDGNKCVWALVNSGGSIGYRPMLSQSGPTGAFSAWENGMAMNADVARPVFGLMSAINSMFFTPGSPLGTGSIFNAAPPIWQELSFEVCGDDLVKPAVDSDGVPGPVLESSFMPSQYLYLDGKAMDLEGGLTGSALPAVTGDFDDFSGISKPYGECGPGSSFGGNPWPILSIDSAGTDPTTSHFCAENSTPPDPAYSG